MVATRRSLARKQEEEETAAVAPVSSGANAVQEEKIVIGKVTKRTKDDKKTADDEKKKKKITDTREALLTSSKYPITRRQPTELPPFTLDDLRNEIKDLFVKPFWKTMSYIIMNLFFCSAHFIAHLFVLKLALLAAQFVGTTFELDMSELAQYDTWVPFDFEQKNYTVFLTQTFNALFAAPFVAAFTNPVLAVYTLVLAAGVFNYCYWQSHFFTGLLIIGHECGHKALFEKNLIWFGHIWGWIFHSFLFIPYFSWSFTHRTHHSFNKNQSYDEVHMMPTMGTKNWKSVALPHEPDQHKDLPPKKQQKFFSSFKAFAKEVHENIVEFNFVYRCFYYFLYYTVGFPLYLTINAGGNAQKYGDEAVPNHWSPNSPVFHKGEGLYVLISNVGILLNITWIYFAWVAFGTPFMICAYLYPWLQTHFYFVMYTMAHHDHTVLPSYSGDRWNYLQGALSTIDRTHGPVIDYLWHYITKTHVIHHIFSDLPFYNSVEATERLKPILGDYYMSTDEDNVWFGAWISLWRNIRDCTFLAEDDHPGLILINEAYQTSKKLGVPIDHPKVQEAVEAKLPEALENNPHKDGRNVDAEVFWPRTFQL
eukprot:UN00499